ncbi:MAG TPA: hypothetical protein VJ371_07885 [Streptosporangiaceae bacterium]|nr:hypothetical protein [Streptosporangiaceae bacterium]
MRYRLMATYLGVPYHAGLGPDGNEATLFSPGPPPDELGFTAAGGHWRKQVSVTDLDALWQSRVVGEYRGEPCLVLDDLADRLHIVYLGRDSARARQLGYWEIDREVFEVVVARSDVTGLAEERVDFPLTAAMFGASRASAPEAEPTGYAEPAAYAEPAGFAAANGNSGSPEKTGPETYHGAAVNGGPTGNGQLAGYGGTDHASRMPDRMTAWHGSPEPWPGPRTPAGDRADDLVEDAADGAAEGRPRPRRAPRPGPWPEPWTEDEPGTEPWTEDEPGTEPWTEREPGSAPEIPPVPGRRTGRKDRISPESVFAELLSLAAIPQGAYVVDEEVPGAMCLVEADGGFEVFSRTEDARLEVHFFEDEEAAYFYLFGVLAAEAIRSGRLGPNGSARVNGHHNGSAPAGPSGTSPASAENVSKYLRGRKLPNSASRPARVYLAGGADGPPLPKQPRRPPEAQVD